MMSASVRFSIDCSMKVAGLKIVESIFMSGRPGANSASAASTPRVTSIMFAHGSFSTINIRLTSSSMTASPIIAQVSHLTLPMSRSRGGAIAPFFTMATGTPARCSGVNTGVTWRITSLWLGVSIIPSIRVFAPVRYPSRLKDKEFAVVSLTVVRLTL